MDTFNPNNATPPSSFSTETPQKKSYGPLIAVLIILFIIIIGGLYFLGQRMNQTPYEITDQNQNMETDEITGSLQNQSSSDEIEMIEADLEATDLENLDQGAAAVEAELE